MKPLFRYEPSEFAGNHEGRTRAFPPQAIGSLRIEVSRSPIDNYVGDVWDGRIKVSTTEGPELSFRARRTS